MDYSGHERLAISPTDGKKILQGLDRIDEANLGMVRPAISLIDGISEASHIL